MKIKIIKEKTRETPSFEIEGYTLILEGTFIPESTEFLENILEEITKEKISKLIFKIPFSNNIANKFIVNLIYGFPVKEIHWYYVDEETEELGETFETIFPELKFILIKDKSNSKIFN